MDREDNGDGTAFVHGSGDGGYDSAGHDGDDAESSDVGLDVGEDDEDEVPPNDPSAETLEDIPHDATPDYGPPKLMTRSQEELLQDSNPRETATPATTEQDSLDPDTPGSTTNGKSREPGLSEMKHFTNVRANAIRLGVKMGKWTYPKYHLHFLNIKTNQFNNVGYVGHLFNGFWPSATLEIRVAKAKA